MEQVVGGQGEGALFPPAAGSECGLGGEKTGIPQRMSAQGGALQAVVGAVCAGAPVSERLRVLAVSTACIVLYVGSQALLRVIEIPPLAL